MEHKENKIALWQVLCVSTETRENWVKREGGVRNKDALLKDSTTDSNLTDKKYHFEPFYTCFGFEPKLLILVLNILIVYLLLEYNRRSTIEYVFGRFYPEHQPQWYLYPI